jgi:hypothetical protein
MFRYALIFAAAPLLAQKSLSLRDAVHLALREHKGLAASSFAAVLILIYGLVVGRFQPFVTPPVIMAAIPLSRMTVPIVYFIVIRRRHKVPCPSNATYA